MLICYSGNMYNVKMYTIFQATVFLMTIVPSSFGKPESLSTECLDRIEALERRDKEHSSRIKTLEQQIILSNEKLTIFSELNEDLQKHLAAKTNRLAEQDGIIEALKKDVELQKSEAESNRRKVEIVELKFQKLSERPEETDEMFVHPKTNTVELKDIKAILDRTGEYTIKKQHRNNLDSNTENGEQEGSVETELESSLANHKLAKNRIIDLGSDSDIVGKLFNTLTGNRLHTSVNGKLKTRHTGHVSKRFLTNGVQEGPVAFHAVIARNHVEHLGLDQNIVFESVNLNLGGGYHDQHGLFIAPKSGLYIFSTSILSYVNAKAEFYAAIVKNGNILGYAYGHGDSGRHDQGSVTVVTQLNVGDEVSVKNEYIADHDLWGDRQCSFMGILVIEI